MMKSITRIFTAAAFAVSSFFTISAADAFEPPQPSADPVEAMTQSPTCLAFEALDRNGFQFDLPEEHLYDETLQNFAEGLTAYSDWKEIKARLEKLGASLNGVCAQSMGPEAGLIRLNSQLGSLNLNLLKGTPWGPDLLSPDEVQEKLDLIIHYSTFKLTGMVAGSGMITTDLDPEVMTFLGIMRNVNGHAEAILSTMERGLAENRLSEVQDLIYKSSPMFKDEIDQLYNKALTSGTLTEEDRQAFKASLAKNLLKDPHWRTRSFQEAVKVMQKLAKKGINVADLFQVMPSNDKIKEQFEARFGEDIANLEIDGKPLLQTYIDYWANNPNDPAAQIKQQIAQFKTYIDMLHKQKAEQELQENIKDGEPLVKPDEQDKGSADFDKIKPVPAPTPNLPHG